MYTEFMKKKVFKLLTLSAAPQVRRRHGRQKVSIPECDLTGTLEERFTIILLPVSDATSKVSCCVELS